VARYELRVGDNHHHVVCRSCGDVVDIDCAVGAAPCLDPSDLNLRAPGFEVHEAEVTYWGLCAACAESATIQPDLTAPPRTERSRTIETRTHRA
jgi:Fur family ferric uptake transcriptional regulator